MPKTKLTAETITNQQIQALRDEAVEVGDDRTMEYCDIALAAHRCTNTDGSDLVWPWNGQRADRNVARQVCADAINAADD